MAKIKDLIERQEKEPVKRELETPITEAGPVRLDQMRGKVPEKGEAKDLQFLTQRTFGTAGLLGVPLSDAEAVVRDQMELTAQRESEMRVVQVIKDAKVLTEELTQRVHKEPEGKRLAFEKREEKAGPFMLVGPIKEMTETMRQVKNSTLAPEEINMAYKKLAGDYIFMRASRAQQIVQSEADVQRFAGDRARQVGQFGGKTWRRWERGTGLVAGGGYHLLDTLERIVPFRDAEGTAAEYARMYHQVLQEPEMQAVVDNWFDRYMGGAVESGPFMAAALAPTMLTGGAVIPSYIAGFLVAYGVEGNSAYQQALDRNEPEWLARTRGVVVGLVNGGIEMSGGGPGKFYKDRIIRNTMGRLGKVKQFSHHAIKNALREGIIEEVPQEISMMVLGGDVPRKADGSFDADMAVTRLWDAAAIGTIAGGMADVAVTSVKAIAAEPPAKPPTAPEVPEILKPTLPGEPSPARGAELAGMSWAELQQEARNQGVNAFQKRNVLTQQLVEKMGQAGVSPAESYNEMNWKELQDEARKAGINAFQKRSDVIDQLLGKSAEPTADLSTLLGEVDKAYVAKDQAKFNELFKQILALPDNTPGKQEALSNLNSLNWELKLVGELSKMEKLYEKGKIEELKEYFNSVWAKDEDYILTSRMEKIFPEEVLKELGWDEIFGRAEAAAEPPAMGGRELTAVQSWVDEVHTYLKEANFDFEEAATPADLVANLTILWNKLKEQQPDIISTARFKSLEALISMGISLTTIEDKQLEKSIHDFVNKLEEPLTEPDRAALEQEAALLQEKMAELNELGMEEDLSDAEVEAATQDYAALELELASIEAKIEALMRSEAVDDLLEDLTKPLDIPDSLEEINARIMDLERELETLEEILEDNLDDAMLRAEIDSIDVALIGLYQAKGLLEERKGAEADERVLGPLERIADLAEEPPEGLGFTQYERELLAVDLPAYKKQLESMTRKELEIEAEKWFVSTEIENLDDAGAAETIYNQVVELREDSEEEQARGEFTEASRETLENTARDYLEAQEGFEERLGITDNWMATLMGIGLHPESLHKILAKEHAGEEWTHDMFLDIVEREGLEQISLSKEDPQAISWFAKGIERLNPKNFPKGKDRTVAEKLYNAMQKLVKGESIGKPPKKPPGAPPVSEPAPINPREVVEKINNIGDEIGTLINERMDDIQSELWRRSRGEKGDKPELGGIEIAALQEEYSNLVDQYTQLYLDLIPLYNQITPLEPALAEEYTKRLERWIPERAVVMKESAMNPADTAPISETSKLNRDIGTSELILQFGEEGEQMALDEEAYLNSLDARFKAQLPKEIQDNVGQPPVVPPKKPPAPPGAAAEEPSPEELVNLTPADPAILVEANDALSAQLAKVERIQKRDVLPARRALRKQQIAKAMGISEAAAAEGASAADVIRRSKGGFRIEMAIAEMTPLELTPEQWDAYSRQVYNTYPGPEFQFQQTTAQDALDALREGRIPTDSQVALLVPIMGVEVIEDMVSLMERLGKKEQRYWNITRDVILFWKSPFNYDVQFVRNAINFLPTNPILFTQGTYKALRAHASQVYADNLIDAVRMDPEHQNAVDAGMPFLETGVLATQAKLPDPFKGRLPLRMTRLGRKSSVPIWLTTMPIRGIGRAQLAAERGFVASANWFMLQLWKSKVDGWNRSLAILESEGLSQEERTRIEDKVTKHQENFVEVVATYMKILRAKSSTGRAIQTAANFILWSPSMTWARFRRPRLLLTASGNRAYAMALEAATVGKIYLVMMMATAIANFFRDDDDQVKVDYDPRSSDWGKFTVGKGDTKFDFGGGEMQHYRTMAQFVVGSVKTQSGRIVEVPRLDIIKSYIEGRETALIGVIHELLTGETVFGQKVWAAPDLEALKAEGTVTAEIYAEAWRKVENIPGGKGVFLTGKYLIEHLLPAALHSFAEAAITDGWAQAVAAGVTEGLALGVQSYKKRASAELTILQDDLAQAVYKKDWETLNEREQDYIRTTEPILAEKQVDVRRERQRFVEKPFERREARKTEDRLFKALSKAVQKELKKFGLTAGAVSRRFGPVTAPFYLSDVRFEKYEELTKQHVQRELDWLFGKAAYKKLDLTGKESEIRAALAGAKRTARGELRTLIDKGTLE